MSLVMNYDEMNVCHIFFAELILNLKMLIDMPMKGLINFFLLQKRKKLAKLRFNDMP
jgi:hypothetical protein